MDTINQSAIDYRADVLLKYYFNPTVREVGIGRLGQASVAAALHVKKTIDALITTGADRVHIDFYKRVFEKLNCPFKPYSIII